LVNRLQKSQKKVPTYPKIEESLDIRFTKYFISNGGFFLYNDSQDLVLSNFNNICIENGWDKGDVVTLNSKIAQSFELPHWDSSSGKLDTFKALLIECEYLIGNTGKILLSSQQIHHFKLNELPQTLIVTANLKQLTRDVSEGMTLLKNKYKNTIPTNITTLKIKSEPTEDKKNLTSRSNTKNIYLLLKDF
jgi:hypothetical protein